MTENIDIKVVYGAQVKRLSLAPDSPNHAQLCSQFKELFELDAPIRIGYVDEDGDKVVLTNDVEVEELFATADKDENAPYLRFFVTTHGSTPSATVEDPAEEPLPPVNDNPLEELRAAFESLINSPDVHNALDALIRSACRYADSVAHQAGERAAPYGERFGYEIRRGVEDFLSGIFNGLGMPSHPPHPPHHPHGPHEPHGPHRHGPPGRHGPGRHFPAPPPPPFSMFGQFWPFGGFPPFGGQRHRPEHPPFGGQRPGFPFGRHAHGPGHHHPPGPPTPRRDGPGRRDRPPLEDERPRRRHSHHGRRSRSSHSDDDEWDEAVASY